ncbi:M50 family metallopeptidase [Lacisediminihabitans profunda]|uniref:PDZ domain-containing protein n=1 Tax=Lacisediminihabitans profunda TaxID=2594790 RepID=A0A5C8UM16_9MICO|nr:site-2 protease family protein [Lacisediminihabitans profunda]TXN28510.1 PDZ domain-containing protein [Lacisediminihabitans profunda]
METVLLYILGILVVLVGIAVSIGLHEVGHLVPAKLFGVRVGQYMIGFGPTLFSRKRGETEYGVKAIPLGGYISMTGMYPPAREGGKVRSASTGFFQSLVQDARSASADTIREGDENRVFYKLPVYKRVIIMLGGPFMNLVIAVVLFAIVLCGFGTQQLSTTVGSVSACVVPASSASQKCTPDAAAAPGAAAGIKPGDKILSINGSTIDSWTQATSIIRKSAGDSLAITVLRDGKKVDLTATPLLTERYVYDAAGKVVEDASKKPVTEKVGFLGIGAAYELKKQPVSAVLPAVGTTIGQDVHLILNLPARLVDVANAAFGPGARDPNGPVSVVGVGRLAGEITSINTIPFVERFSYLLGIIASLNVALLVFNLVPLMPLDGGHVAGALWEAIRRFFAKLFKRRDPGPVDTARLVPLTFAIVIVLGAMSVLLIYADIVKPIPIG